MAICLIGLFVEDFDADIIWQNLMFWMRSVLQLINSKTSTAILDLTLKSIPKLLKISLEFDDLSKELSLNIIHPLLNCLLQSTGTKARCLVNKLAAFSSCIMYYPGPTGRFRMQLENLCLALFSSHEKALRDEACRCMSLLPKCGPSGEKATKFAEMWNKHFKMATETLDLLFDGLTHAKADKETSKEKDTRTFRFSQISLAEPEFSTVTALRMKSLLFMIELMLSHKFPHTIEIDVGIFLHLCKRVFSKEIDFQDVSIESVCLQTVLPQLWNSILSLMNVLLAQMGSLLLPFEYFIFQIAYQILTHCRNGIESKSQSASLRIQGYQLLDSWHLIVGPLSSESLKNLVDVILTDIRPHLQTERTVETVEEGKQKKRKKSKLHDEIAKSEMALKMINSTEGSEITYAALTLLSTVISTSGSIMWTDLMLQIEKEVLSISRNLVGLSKQAECGFPSPYGNDKCRKKLLMCTFWLANLYHHQIPTPFSTLISIFQDYTSDPSPIVSRDCTHFLSLMDKIIHPSVPALREYHEDDVHHGNTVQTNAKAPLLSTGLFNELCEVTHLENTRPHHSSFDNGDQRPLLDSTVSPRALLNNVSSAQSTDRIVADRSESTQESSKSGDLNKLEMSNQKLVGSEESAFEVQRKSEIEFQDKDIGFAYENEEKENDDTIELDEIVAKRARFDDMRCGGEAKQSQSKAVENLNYGYLQGGKKTDQTEIMEATMDEDCNEILDKSDDESSTFLKSFVNSFPDSE